MYFILLITACYTMRWSVMVLLGEVELDQPKARVAFGMGLLSAPVTVWTGVHFILL